jgi:hypothetical protein
MSSLRQIAANRHNADKSTGPVTPEGKERSRGNALRHGLTAETVIATLEDAEDYQAFELAVTADYDAQSAVERELVLRLASILWRLRRATGIESALFETVIAELPSAEIGLPDQTSSQAALALVGPGPVQQNQLRANGELEQNARAEREHSSNSKSAKASAFLRLAALPTFPLDRLSRYEHTLWRQAKQIIFALQSMRTRTRPPGRPSFSFFRAGRR